MSGASVIMCRCGGTCERCTAAHVGGVLVCPPRTGINVTLSGIQMRSVEQQLAILDALGTELSAVRWSPDVLSGTFCCYELGLTPATYGCRASFVSADPVAYGYPQHINGDGTSGGDEPDVNPTPLYIGVPFDCNEARIAIGIPGAFATFTSNPTTDEVIDTRPVWGRDCTTTGFSADNAIQGDLDDVSVAFLDNVGFAHGLNGTATISGTCDPPFCGTCDESSVYVTFSRPAGEANEDDPGLSQSYTVPRVSSPSQACSYQLHTTYAGKPVTVTVGFFSAGDGNRWVATFAFDSPADAAALNMPQVFTGSRRCAPPLGGVGPLGNYTVGGAGSITVA